MKNVAREGEKKRRGMKSEMRNSELGSAWFSLARLGASCSTLLGLQCLLLFVLLPSRPFATSSAISSSFSLVRMPNANVWLMRRTHTRSRARAACPRRRRSPCIVAPTSPCLAAGLPPSTLPSAAATAAASLPPAFLSPSPPPLPPPLPPRPQTQCATSHCLGVTVMTYSHMHARRPISQHLLVAAATVAAAAAAATASAVAAAAGCCQEATANERASERATRRERER